MAKKAVKKTASRTVSKKTGPKKSEVEKKPVKDEIPLPSMVRVSDLTWPKHEDHLEYAVEQSIGTYSAVMYFTKSFGWVVCTLPISKGKSGRDDRFYAVTLDDGQVCRVGNGPHVLRSITVYFSKSNLERLALIIERYQTGLEAAGSIRDRISTRRAQGQIHRQNGRSSWQW